MCLAVPGKVIAVVGDGPLHRTGKVSFGGILKEVNMSCVPEAAVGDYVVVHAGLALSKMDEAEAEQVFEYLRQIDELNDLAETSP